MSRVLDEAECGSRILLAPGDYRGELSLRATCDASKPILLLARDQAGTILRDRMTLGGANLVVVGLSVDGGGFDLRGRNIRITGNRFLSGGGIVIRGPSNRVDHNAFEVPAGDGVDIAVKLTARDNPRITDNLIDHNLFRTGSAQSPDRADEDDDPRRPSVGIYLGEFSARRGREAMLGYGPTGNVVEQNLFQDFGRRRSVHIKSLGNIVRGNTVLATGGRQLRAQLTVRSGQDNEIIDNWLAGRTALRVFEERNRLIGNVLADGAELLVMGGGGELTGYGSPQQREASGTVLSGNRGPVRIGVTYPRRANKTPARDTVIEGHDGPVELLLETGTVTRAGTAAAGGAHALTVGDVGPGSAGSFCDALPP